MDLSTGKPVVENSKAISPESSGESLEFLMFLGAIFFFHFLTFYKQYFYVTSVKVY
jgi:hypothetical protein